MSRSLVLASCVLVLVGGLIATALSTRSSSEPVTPPTSRATLPVAPRRSAELPPAHRAAAVRSSLAGFGDWLAASFPKAQPAFLGADCSSPPCMIGIRFDGAGLSPAEVRALLGGARREIERRAGIAMTVIHSDQDASGRDHLWMYGLPAELASEPREQLRAAAESRHSSRMDPVRAPIEPHVPGMGEPGYKPPS